MNKKSQITTLEYALRLIIVALVVLFLVSCVTQACKRLQFNTNQYVNKVFETISKFSEQKENDFAFFPVRMDKNTAFFGFHKNQREINFEYRDVSLNYGYVKFKIERPQTCEIDSGCFCFCKNMKSILNNFKCKFEDLNCVKGNFTYLVKTCKDEKDNKCIISSDGFILFYYLESLDTNLNTEQMDHSIYIEKISNSIGICSELKDGLSCVLPSPTKTPVD